MDTAIDGIHKAHPAKLYYQALPSESSQGGVFARKKQQIVPSVPMCAAFTLPSVPFASHMQEWSGCLCVWPTLRPRGDVFNGMHCDEELWNRPIVIAGLGCHNYLIGDISICHHLVCPDPDNPPCST